MRKSMKKALATFAAFALAFSFAAGGIADTASAGVDCSKAGKKAGKKEVDLDGTYHAYFGFQQQDSWVFRNSWYEPTLGKDGENLVGDATYDQMLTTLDVADAIPVGGTVTDAEISGNGTYRVGVTGLDTSKLVQDTEKIYLTFVSTDIPSSAMDKITISDVKLYIDGVEKWSGEPYVNEDAKEWGLYQFDIINRYQGDGYENPSIPMMPSDSIEIEFTVAGFNSDNPDANGDSLAGGDDATSGSDAATSETGATSAEATTESDNSSSAVPIVVGVIIAVVVIAGIVIVVKKKKN